MSELVLKGIDGANPLGFLAAMGTFAAADDIWPGQVRLSWTKDMAFRPIIRYPSAQDGKSANSVEDCRRAFAETIAGALGVPAKELKEEDQSRVEGMFKAFVKCRKEQAAAEKKNKEKIRDLTGRGKNEGLKDDSLRQWVDEQSRDFLGTIHEKKDELQSLRRAWLEELEKIAPSAELRLGKTLSINRDEFRNVAESLLEKTDHRNRRAVDLLTAFAVETIEDRGSIKYTPFCFVTGSGHQYFLDTVGKLMQKVEAGRIERCLFSTWMFEDDRLSLRWSPMEDRRYALMWGNPSNQEVKTDWAANLLAYQGLRLFPVADVSGRFHASGFSKADGRHYFSWPVWDGFISLDVARSLLAHDTLRRASLNKKEILKLQRFGVMEIFRCDRLRVGTPPLEKLNFSVSAPV